MENINISCVNASNNLKEMLFNKYVTQNFVDISIATSNGSLKCHSLILTNNKIFRDKLEELNNYEEKIINIPQFSCATIKVILEYLYRGEARYFVEIEEEVHRAIDYFFGGMKRTFTPDQPEIPEASNSIIFQDPPEISTYTIQSSDDDSDLDKNYCCVNTREVSPSANKIIKSETSKETEQNDETNDDGSISSNTDNNKLEGVIEEFTENRNKNNYKRVNPFSSQLPNNCHTKEKRFRSNVLDSTDEEDDQCFNETEKKIGNKLKSKEVLPTVKITKNTIKIRSEISEEQPSTSKDNTKQNAFKKKSSSGQWLKTSKTTDSSNATNINILRRTESENEMYCVICKIDVKCIKHHRKDKHRSQIKIRHICEKCSSKFHNKYMYEEHLIRCK